MTATLWLIVGLVALLLCALTALALVILNLPAEDDWQAEPDRSHSGAILHPVITHDTDGLTITEWHGQRETGI